MNMMAELRQVTRTGVRALGAGLVGAALILMGLAALRAPDPGSQVGVVPLLTSGGALTITALGVLALGVRRWLGQWMRRARLSRKLPRAVVVRK